MSAAPWLSVLMPVYQGASHLDAALESVAREGVDGVEIVVADDGSTDGTLEIVERRRRSLPIRLVHRGGDGRWPEGANRALREARGEHACLLFHDDLWVPGRLAAVRAALAREPSCTLVVGPARFVGPDGEPLGPCRTPFGRRELRLEGPALVDRLLVQNFLASPAPVFRREAALAAGGLDPALWYTADWDLWLKLARAGPAAHVGQPLAAYRVHDASMTASRRRTAAELRAQLEVVLERHAGAAGRPSHAAVLRAARASVDVNVALAEAARGRAAGWGRALASLARLGPTGAVRLAHDARLPERLGARLRLALARALTFRGASGAAPSRTTRPAPP